jgi:hypothetical protein
MAFAELFNNCCVSLPVFYLLSVPRLPSSISQQPGFSNFHFQPRNPSLLFTNMHTCLVNSLSSSARFDRDCLAHAESSPATWNRADGPRQTMGGWLRLGISERLPSGGFTSRTALLSGVAINRISGLRARFQSFERVWCCEASQPTFNGLRAGDEEDAGERKERTTTTTRKLTSLVEQAISLSNRQDPGTSPSPSPDGWRRMEKMGLRYVWSDFHPECFPIVSPMLDHPTEADWILSDHVGAESTTCVCRSLQGEAQ